MPQYVYAALPPLGDDLLQGDVLADEHRTVLDQLVGATEKHLTVVLDMDPSRFPVVCFGGLFGECGKW